MYPRATVDEARRLAGTGLHASAVAHRLGLPAPTVAHWLRGDRRGPRADGRDTVCPRGQGAPLDEQAYSYLLGAYLGDGHIVVGRRGVASLSVFCDDAWPGVADEVHNALDGVMPCSSVCTVARAGCSEIKSYSRHWPRTRRPGRRPRSPPRSLPPTAPSHRDRGADHDRRGVRGPLGLVLSHRRRPCGHEVHQPRDHVGEDEEPEDRAERDAGRRGRDGGEVGGHDLLQHGDTGGAQGRGPHALHSITRSRGRWAITQTGTSQFARKLMATPQPSSSSPPHGRPGTGHLTPREGGGAASGRIARHGWVRPPATRPNCPPRTGPRVRTRSRWRGSGRGPRPCRGAGPPRPRWPCRGRPRRRTAFPGRW